MPMVFKFVAHSATVGKIAVREGWLPAARYTNLRDVRRFDRVGFLDIDWKNYQFRVHLNAVRATRPAMTVARDLVRMSDLNRVVDEAEELRRYAGLVVVVPKAIRLAERIDAIPTKFVLGFSVPTKYGATRLPVSAFRNRPVHLLGGRPDVQRRLGDSLHVVSMDCNRFTLDAMFGDYFDGETFRPHPRGGYRRCLRESVRNINALWDDYALKSGAKRKWAELNHLVRPS
jgi:hypothetical protein